MNNQKLPSPPMPAPGDRAQARDMVEASAQDAVLRQHQEKRLARLFMHAGDHADDCYLRDLMTRYRGLVLS